MIKPVRSFVLSVVLVLAARTAFAESVWLSSLDLSKMQQGFGEPQADKSVTKKPLTIAKKTYEHGVGTHAHSVMHIDLAGGSERFQAVVGLDDGAKGKGSAIFKIYADGKRLWESGMMKTGDAAKPVDVNLKGMKKMVLVVDKADGGITNDNANWADAKFDVSGAKPKAVDVPVEKAEILTPPPPPAPRINGPKVYGARPGNPFLFRIPSTGQRPIQFSAVGLPDGLKLDAATGIITGTTPARGEYVVALKAKNASGEAERKFKIVSGDTLALTPTMGWNDWYAHYARVTDEMMRQAADIMISSGMADVGYDYVDIDDCWMNAVEDAKRKPDPGRIGPCRDDKGNIIPNKHFPDMKALTDYIHSKGLKVGTYTSPGTLTCAGYCGAYEHEAADAKQFADWGFDLLKYDWCSYGKITPWTAPLEEIQKPYRLMGGLLKQQKRDIVFNLCQYGRGDVWKWGAEIGGHSWRTAGDLGYSLDRIFQVALKNAEHRDWQKPGAWNDPDYIQIGYVGVAKKGDTPKQFPLTPTEQYSFMSLWCLMASPIVYSGDMTMLDSFTLNVLCNPELIEVNQDPLGQCAAVVAQEDEAFIMVKDLEDGSKAVGLCNGREMETTMTATWKDIGVKGKQTVRDLWRQVDLGEFENEFKATVPRHGVVIVRMRK